MQIALRICVACHLWWHPGCPQGSYFVASWLTPASSPALFIQVQFLDEPVGWSTAIPVWSSSLLQVRAVSALQSNILVLHQSGKKLQPCPVSKEGRSSRTLLSPKWLTLLTTLHPWRFFPRRNMPFAVQRTCGGYPWGFGTEWEPPSGAVATACT